MRPTRETIVYKATNSPSSSLFGEANGIKDAVVCAVPACVEAIDLAAGKDRPMAVQLAKPVHTVRVRISGLEVLRLVPFVILCYSNVLRHRFGGSQANAQSRLDMDGRMGLQASNLRRVPIHLYGLNWAWEYQLRTASHSMILNHLWITDRLLHHNGMHRHRNLSNARLLHYDGVDRCCSLNNARWKPLHGRDNTIYLKMGQ